MNTYQLKLDLNKGPTYSVGAAYSGITLRQGDKRGCTVVAELYDHGTRFTESGYTAYFVMGLPDREHYYREAATYSSGTVSIIIDESVAASVAGDTIAYFELTRGDAIYSTQGIKVSVLKDARADKTPGETYDSRIEQAIQDLETAIAQAETQIEADVAEWLDQHPEATTTVQDGSITYAKLHSSTKQRLNNKLHRLVTAPVVTASDAYAAPPVALVVDGKSVQDGTPTPDAPVAIASVESVGLAAAERNLVNSEMFPATFTNTNAYYIECNTHNGLLKDRIRLVAGVTYTFSVDVTSSVEPFQITVGAGSGQVLRDVFTKSDCTSGRNTFTFTPNESQLSKGDEFAFRAPRYSSTTRFTCTIDNVMLVRGTVEDYQPYVGSTTTIPLQGHALRSLPDGTHDELRVDADGNVTLVQRVGSVTFDGSESWAKNASETFINLHIESLGAKGGTSALMSNQLAYTGTITNTSTNEGMHIITSGAILRVRTSLYPTADVWTAHLAETPMVMDYPLAEPVEISLGTVALPSMPAPDLTAWASCTPATEIELDYERSVTIAVERLEAQIAEIATA